MTRLFKLASLPTAVVMIVLSSISSAVATPIVIFNNDIRTTPSGPTGGFPNSIAARNTFLSDVTSMGGTPYSQNLTSPATTGIAAPASNPSFGYPGSTITSTTTELTYQQAPLYAINDANTSFAVPSYTLIETEVASGTASGGSVPNSIQFSQPINAFGLYLIQAGDTFQHPITFELTNTGVPGSTRDIVIPVGPNWGAYSTAYLGIIDTTPFNSFTMIENTDANNDGIIDDPQDGILFDNLTIAQIVPEPSSLVLCVIGVGGLLLVRRRAACTRG